MADRVAGAITKHDVLVAEAGTGTGKTFAYLVPALVSSARIIVSTGTKTLQDQLFDRDIPALKNALHVSATVALLKGRANYVCRYRLQRARDAGNSDAQLRIVSRFANISQTGDRGELAEVPEDATIWPLVTSTRENCLAGECPEFKRCFVMEARKKALSADIVVVNHHLFFADLALRDEGLGELLPACDAVIFDEAHQLPEVARMFFGERVSTGQIVELARDTGSETLTCAPDFTPLLEAAAALDKGARDLRLTLGQTGKIAAAAVPPRFDLVLAEVSKRLRLLNTLLETQSQRSPGLANCQQRCAELGSRIQNWREEGGSEAIRWVEVLEHGLQLNSAPISVAEKFQKQAEQAANAMIFTSASLSVNGDFRHFLQELGIPNATTAYWESPYDYASQALLYLPRDMPDPNDAAHTNAVVSAVLPVLQASPGKAFLLFTSLRALVEARRLLVESFAAAPVFAQGEAPRSELLERFRRAEHAVLLGSQSFWQGVDVRGLSLVLIDKLPFASPDDPMLAGRIERLEAQGRSAFNEIQLPHAVILLKQGTGRLIRDENDRGVLMICDRRIIAKSYGRRLMQSLPPMKQTRDLSDVNSFFAGGQAGPKDRERRSA